MSIGGAIKYIKMRDCTFFLDGYSYSCADLSKNVSSMIARYIEERDPRSEWK